MYFPLSKLQNFNFFGISSACFQLTKTLAHTILTIAIFLSFFFLILLCFALVNFIDTCFFFFLVNFLFS